MRRSFLFVSSSSSSSSSSNISATHLKTQTRSIIFSTHGSPTLEEVAVKRGFESPFWIDTETLRKDADRYGNIHLKSGEAPTAATIQREIALYNLDQLRANPRGLDFVKKIPRNCAYAADATTLQPFRGALKTQLELVAASNKWGNYWVPSPAIKKQGFMFVKQGQWEPAGWKAMSQVWNVVNFDQLESAAGVDLATVPINFRYGTLLMGTEVGEILRNEALRRGTKYPVAATNKLIELCGCSILPDKVSGFVVNTTSSSTTENVNNNNNLQEQQAVGNGNRFNNYNKPYNFNNAGSSVAVMSPQQQSMSKYSREKYQNLYNLDEFDVGSDVIVNAMKIDNVASFNDTPTFLMTMKPIMRQLVLNDGDDNNKICDEENKSKQQNEGENQVLDQEKIVDENTSASSSSSSSTSSCDVANKDTFPVLGRFKTNLWLRENEALQLANGSWKLKPNAKGATLGMSLHFLRQQQELQKLSSADGTGDLTLKNTRTEGGGDNFASTSQNSQNTNNNNSSFFNFNRNNYYQQYKSNFAPSPYYFDSDVKERREFLACLGKYGI